jgi:hypothetical protein
MLLVLATVIVIAFLLGMVISAAMNRRTKGEEAPNLTPYYSDEVLEGPRLNRVLAWALAGSAVVAVALPTYWLLEPGRQNSSLAPRPADRRTPWAAPTVTGPPVVVVRGH